MKRLPQPLTFEWDDGNKDKNWLKHQVANSEAEECFFDKNKRFAEGLIKLPDGEERFILIGQTKKERLLVIVFTIRETKVRIISARDINRKERFLYEQEN